MRLFLASHDFGDYMDVLLRLMHGGRKALIIANARDHYPEEKRRSVVSEKIEIMKQAGIEAKELDLKKFFAKKEELSAFINSYSPDLIFAIGGNVFLLSTAYQLSGFSKIVLEDLKQDKYVYGGSSAGAVVAASTLKYYDDDFLAPYSVYGVDATLDGLGLIDEYIIPHADVPEYLEVINSSRRRIEKDGKKALLLGQLSAMIIDGVKIKVLRTEI